MINIHLTPSDYERNVAKEPQISLRNRYAEQNPALNDSPVSLISRPGLKKWQEVGDGPVRKVYSSVGAFNDDLFVVSGTNLYRVASDVGTVTLIGALSTNPLGDVSMAVAAPIGAVPAYLFIAEGGVLWVYTNNGHAFQSLVASGAISDGNTVVIDGVYYEFDNSDVTAGTPDGTSGNPWLVAMGSSTAEALGFLASAITASGVAGVDYSTSLTAHPTVNVRSYTATDVYIQAIEPGVTGNAIAVSETGSNLAWTSGTLAGGGNSQLVQVQVPDDAGAISVTHINSHIVVVPVQDEDLETMGRFYWIEPGEIVIDPPNYATAERSPDGIHQALTFGDMFWLFGGKTVEPWITTGNPEAPMERFKGILFDRGSWEGTAIQVADSLVVIDENGGVFQLSSDGRGQRRISRPDIEERIRVAMQRIS